MLTPKEYKEFSLFFVRISILLRQKNYKNSFVLYYINYLENYGEIY